MTNAHVDVAVLGDARGRDSARIGDPKAKLMMLPSSTWIFGARWKAAVMPFSRLVPELDILEAQRNDLCAESP